jgi:8-oxo-dGTP pyrophosphatase MutT (NUDIX family)
LAAFVGAGDNLPMLQDTIAVDWRIRERRGGRRKSGWQTSGGVVVDVDSRQVLLVKNRREKREGGSGWTWPKGRIDPGEGPVYAAIREIVEETGVLSEPLGRVALLETSKALRHYYLMMLISEGVEHQQETIETSWVSMKRAQKMLERKRDRQVLQASRRMLERLEAPRLWSPGPWVDD